MYSPPKKPGLLILDKGSPLTKLCCMIENQTLLEEAQWTQFGLLVVA